MKRFSIKKIIAGILSTVMVMASFNFTTIDVNAYVTDESGLIRFEYTGRTETYEITEDGDYIIELAGASGGFYSPYVWEWDSNGNLVNEPTGEIYYGGEGGIIKAKVHLSEGDILYVNIGEKGFDCDTDSGLEGITSKGTFGGGGAANKLGGYGGGSSDIRLNGISLSNRFLIAGGGGGGCLGYDGLDGGAATSGNSNDLFNGSSAYSVGSGGGGGYCGGTPGVSNGTAARGGSNYFDDNYGEIISNNASTNNNYGYCQISKLNEYSVKIDFNGGNYYGNEEPIYYSKTSNSASSTSQTFNYTGKTQIYRAPADGAYKLEVIGASGGGYAKSVGDSTRGYGGKATGYVNLKKDTVLYVNVGGCGTISSGGWNGGGNPNALGAANAYGGGGATDISLYGTENTTNWKTTEHLYSRLIVKYGVLPSNTL